MDNPERTALNTAIEVAWQEMHIFRHKMAAPKALFPLISRQQAELRERDLRLLLRVRREARSA